MGGVVAIAGDAWLGASLTTAGVTTIGGNLHLVPGATLNSLLPANVGGQTSVGAFSTDPPCPCGAEQTLDIAAAVASAQSANGDVRLNLSPDALSAQSSGAQFQWSCGTILLTSIGGTGAVRLGITGRVALLVQGDVDLPSSFVLDLASGAALDWFVGGHFTVAPGARIGDASRPGAVRLYVAGGGAIALPGDATVALSLYAPAASVTVGGLGSVYGSVFALSITAPTGLVVHDDPLASAEVCPSD